MPFSSSLNKFFIFSLVLYFVVAFGVSTCSAQLLNQNEKPEPPPKNVALEYSLEKIDAMTLDQLTAELAKVVPEFRQAVKAMLSARTRFEHAAKNESYGYGKSWRENAIIGQTAYQKIKELSMAIYLKAEKPTDEQFTMAFRMLLASADEGRIGIANRVLKKMMEEHADDEQVWINAGRIAVFTNDCEPANQLLQRKPAIIEKFSRQGKVLFAGLEEFSKRWAKEKAIRKAEAEADDLPRVELTTSKGKIVIELFENEAPHTVGNFIHLVESGFYSEMFFHQVLRNFRSQVGLFSKKGMSPTDYEIVNESNADNARNIFRGTIATLPKGSTAGAAEFSIYSAPNPFASDDYEETVFGRVISGMDVVDILKVNSRFAKGGSVSEHIKPKQGDMPDDYILSAKVLRKRPNVNYQPKKLASSKK